MNNYFEIISWTPSGSAAGSGDLNLLIVVVMSFIGASIVTRIAEINTSFNFSVNFAAMLTGCLVVQAWTSDALMPVSNSLIASAVSANFGMTLAGCALLFGYRKSY